MVEDNERTHGSTRFIRRPPGERTPEDAVEPRPTPKGEPQAPAEGDDGTYQGVGFTGRIPRRSVPNLAEGPRPAPEPRMTAKGSEKPSGGNVALQAEPPPHTPHSVLTEGSWKYLGGIPDWHYWNSLEKESGYVLSPNALNLTRSGFGVSILLEAIEGVALDCRWSRPRFLMMFVTSEGVSHIATFEFGQRFRASKAAERFFLKLLKLGVRPDESLADATMQHSGPVAAQAPQNPETSQQPVTRPPDPQQHSNSLTDPLAVYRSNASPTLVRIQGFAIGFFLSIIGVVAVALLSHPSKQGNRLLGAVIGMLAWLGLMWVMGAFDPWLAQYGLNAHICFYNTWTGEVITCDGPWSPQ